MMMMMIIIIIIIIIFPPVFHLEVSKSFSQLVRLTTPHMSVMVSKLTLDV